MKDRVGTNQEHNDNRTAEQPAMPDSKNVASGSKTLAGAVYRRLRADILTGELEGGKKLRLEALTERYGIGMSPLREALSRLVGDALVLSEGQRGFWVSPLSSEEFEDITRVRTLIETEALHLSIERGGPEWEDGVRQAFAILTAVEQRMNAEEGLLGAWEDANRRFHEALICACGSPWLIRFTSALYQQSERYRRISLANASRRESLHDEHNAIADAALRRQSLKACRLAEEHLRRTAETVRAALQKEPSGLRLVGQSGGSEQ